MSDRDRSGTPVQPPLFDMTSRGRFEPEIGAVGPLEPTSKLPVARYWYRRHLEQEQRPINTLRSYLYDLARLEHVIGLKSIDQITRRDIARFLGDANTRSTRKRRLTTVSGFFKWLIEDARMLTSNPTESFYPDQIALKSPKPLFAEEQEAFLAAAEEDSPRSALMCWLMLRLGVGRSELLDLQRSDIELDSDGSAEIYIFPRTSRLKNKERKLEAPREFGKLLAKHMDEYAPQGALFDMLPQSVNKMVDRIARQAGVTKKVTPQSLRDTFAVELAKDGADEDQLIAVLGLADDSRNRMSVQRYIKLGGPAVNSKLMTGQREVE
jgi:integrase/recombinase XerD